MLHTKSTQPGYVISADANILPDAINPMLLEKVTLTESHLLFSTIRYLRSGENTLASNSKGYT